MPSIIGGILAIGLGIWGLSEYWWSFAELLRGLIPLFLVVGGLTALAAGIQLRRGNAGEAKEE